MREAKEKRPCCPECKSRQVIKNGFADCYAAREKFKIQRYRCLACLRVFQEPRIRRVLNG